MRPILYLTYCHPAEPWVVAYEHEDPTFHGVAVTRKNGFFDVQLFTRGDDDPDHALKLGEFKTLHDAIVRMAEAMGWQGTFISPLPFIQAFSGKY